MPSLQQLALPRIMLCLFLLHLAAVASAMVFLVVKTAQAHNAWRQRSLLPVEGAVALSILLAFAWQKAVRVWPRAMARVIPWSAFAVMMSVSSLLMSLSMPGTIGLGIAMVVFSISMGLYTCWVGRRMRFTGQVFDRAMQPVDMFPGLNGPAYLVVVVGFAWISLWCVAVICAVNFRFSGLIILGLVVSLAWTAEVARNVVNLTASKVIALYYERGMLSSVQFSFQSALCSNLGSVCLGSLFVPTIEALRTLARGLNLVLEGEDGFMCCCAHCCLRVMNNIFSFANSWAFVHVAAYERGFVQASRSTLGQFEALPGMVALVDSDITSSVFFLAGVTSGALCVALAGSWAFATDRHYTATVSLLAFFIGYLMTRIGMALPEACVGCYYVCYAENPTSRLFDDTIPDQLRKMQEQEGRDRLHE